MTIATITNILYIWISLSLTFPLIAIVLLRRIKKLKTTQARQEMETKHYEEMLYASKDGYFTYSIYKNKEYHFCSKRLATILNLKKGEDSTFREILINFIQLDAEKLNSSFTLLKKNGLNFETIIHSTNNKTFSVIGYKINSLDSKINSYCLWFKDISKETDFISKITENAISCRKELEGFRTLIDNIPTPVWLRDENLNITILNRPYLELLGLNNFNEITPTNSTLHDLGNTTNLKDLAKQAKETNKVEKKTITLLTKGELKKYELSETPFYNNLTKNFNTIGSMVDVTRFDDAKRNYREHLEKHLEILSSLDTAFCIINTKHQFTYANDAFFKLWELPSDFIETAPYYNLFLDKIREKKILPEVSDFKAYKEEENKAFDALTNQREDMLYIPDGRTFRRIRAPHPDGTIITYEDITDNLNTARRLDDILAVQQGILDNITDSVVIFSPNLKLKTYNTAFLKLWNLTPNQLETSPSIRELLDIEKDLFPEIQSWEPFREDMLKHITACQPFSLQLKNKLNLLVTSAVLADTSLMITYHQK